MFAIKNKSNGELCFLTDTKQYLIWDTEQAAWNFLINEVGSPRSEQYTVIKILWTKA